MTALSSPLSTDEFAALMRPLGPFGTRRVAVAASGGADSTALALLAAEWGHATAFIVDHGLRPESAAEAQLTAERLARRGIPARVLTLSNLPHGPALPARARAARYAALRQACVHEGMVDLLIGHHAGDQAETILLRRDAGSGPTGLAGMAALSVDGPIRRLRPLLAVPPARLRATLRQTGMAWVEDPANADQAYTRNRIRRSSPAAQDAALAWARQAAESASWPAGAAVHPEGYVSLPTGPIEPHVLAACVWTVSGRPYPPSSRSVEHAARTAPATVHHTCIVRRRDRWLVVREPSATGPRAMARPGVTWDARFVVHECAWPGVTIGALGDDSARLRRISSLPSVVLRSLPAIRRGNDLFAVPHLAYPSPAACAAVRIAFRPARPLAGSPFVPAGDVAGMHTPSRHPIFVGDGYTGRAAQTREPGYEDWIV